jgi:peptidyl serine alpha-galactosyltransferase
VNTCCAKFPDPPDPSSIATKDPNEIARDLLSIECAKILNTALYLHHQRRKCPTDVSVGDSIGNEKIKEDVPVETVMSDVNSALNTSLPVHRFKAAARSNMRWRVAVWGISVLGFLVVTFLVLSGRKRERSKPRSSRNKKIQDNWCQI